VFRDVAPFDVGVVVSFGYFLPSSILDPLKLGAINVHPSLLPRYRGAAPIPRCILAGDSTTGLSIIDIDRSKFDAGSILAQQEVAIEANEGSASLKRRLASMGASMVLDVLAGYGQAKASARPQAKEGVTKAPKIKVEEGAVRWDEPAACTVDGVMRMWRAFDDSVGIYSWLGPAGQGSPISSPAGATASVRVKLVEVAPTAPPEDSTLERACAGSLVWEKSSRRLLLRCSDGWLVLLRFQPEFKKVMAGQDLANGYKLKPGLAPVELHYQAHDVQL
jgi:methionyl-tRNA formyltransferase